MRAIVYLMLAGLGVALALFLTNSALERFEIVSTLLDFTVIALIASVLILIFATASNLAIAYALTLGEVWSVRGTQARAELRTSEDNIVGYAAIRLVANLDRSIGSKSKDRQRLIFLANWTPRSCVAARFFA